MSTAIPTARVADVEAPPPSGAGPYGPGFCDETFVRQEMTYVDWVRDREVADVHVLVTEEDTGAGGEAQTFDLVGLGPFQGTDFSTVYTTNVDATQAEEREGFLRTLQAALVPYLLQTPMGERVRVDVEAPEAVGLDQAVLVDDPWDNWTIEIYDRFEREDDVIRSSARRNGSRRTRHAADPWMARKLTRRSPASGPKRPETWVSPRVLPRTPIRRDRVKIA